VDGSIHATLEVDVEKQTYKEDSYKGDDSYRK
jgi:hypothetical protein